MHISCRFTERTRPTKCCRFNSGRRPSVGRWLPFALTYGHQTKLWSPTFRHDTSGHTVTFEKMRSRTSSKVNSERRFVEGPRRSDGWAICFRQSQELKGWTPALPHLSNLLFYFNKTVKTSAPPSAVPLPVKHELWFRKLTLKCARWKQSCPHVFAGNDASEAWLSKKILFFAIVE